MSPDYFEHSMILGHQLIDFHSFMFLAMKLVIDLFFTLLIVRVIFYKVYKERDYVFTLMVINISVFFICFLMESIKVEIGFAFGLFAVFAIMRYRTEQIPIREMTYMFAVVIIAVLNALSGDQISIAEVLLANTIIFFVILFLEKNIIHNNEAVKLITFEKIDLIKPENYPRLLADLTERTGLKVKGAEIESINFLNDTAKLKILFEQPDTAEVYPDYIE